MGIRQRQRYFDTTIHLQPIKDCISGKNEQLVLGILETVGYVLGTDFVRQHPIGCRFVLDFAFVNEQVALEVDGKSHESRAARRIDRQRDRFLRDNNWVSIRILERDFIRKSLFYKYFIQEVVEARRVQYRDGKLFPLDIPDFNQKHYE